MKIKAGLSIGFGPGASRSTVIEIDDEELEGLSEEEKEKVIDEYVQNWADNYIKAAILEKQFYGETIKDKIIKEVAKLIFENIKIDEKK